MLLDAVNLHLLWRVSAFSSFAEREMLFTRRIDKIVEFVGDSKKGGGRRLLY